MYIGGSDQGSNNTWIKIFIADQELEQRIKLREKRRFFL